MKPTVCIVVFKLEPGGAEFLAARVAEKLADNHRFIYVCLESESTRGTPIETLGSPVYELKKQPGLDWSVPHMLRSIVRDERVDLIHAHQYGPFFYSALCRWGSSRPPILFQEHGRQIPDPVRRSHHVANRILLGGKDRVIAVSNQVKRGLVESEGFPSDRVEVVYNGINCEAFDFSRGNRQEVRRELNIAPESFVVMTAARLDPIKDHETSLRSMYRLLQRQSNAILVFVGDGPEAATIDGWVDRLGLTNQVRRLGTRFDVPRLLSAADVGLLNSKSEGLPLFLLEAMATGLPVVGTKVPGIQDVVVEEETGFLADVGDDSSIASHLARLAQDEQLQRRMGRAGRERVVQKFSEARMVCEYERMYHAMIRKETRRTEAPREMSLTGS